MVDTDVVGQNSLELGDHRSADNGRHQQARRLARQRAQTFNGQREKIGDRVRWGGSPQMLQI